MSNRFHNKWHRHNHHTTSSNNEPDSSRDPIASHEDPFQGDFVMNGTMSAMDPDLAGYFYTTNAVSAISIHAIANYGYTLPNPWVYPLVSTPDFTQSLAGKFDGNVIIEHALSAGSVWSPYVCSTYTDVEYINVLVSELSGFSIVGEYFEQLPLNYDYKVNGGVAPYEVLDLNGVALTAGSWAAFDGDIIAHNDAYVEGCLITNCISAGDGDPITVHGEFKISDSATISGNLYVSGDTEGAGNLYVQGSGYFGGDIDIDGIMLEPSATNVYILNDYSLYTNSILPVCGDKIYMGCSARDIGGFDTYDDFGIKICGEISANAIFGLLNTAYTTLELDETICTTAVSGNATLWGSDSSGANWDGIVVLYTEASGVSGYAQVEGYVDDILATQMVVSNPGNITNTLISHPMSAERTLENKQSFTFPIIAGRTWSINLVETYGEICHHIKVYKHVRDVDMTNLDITQNLLVGGNLLVSGDGVFDGDVDIGGNLFVSGHTILEGGLTISGDVFFADDLYVSGSTSIGEDLFVSGISHFGNDIDLECNDLLNVKTIQTTETCTPTISVYNNLQVATTSGLIIPVGTTAQRSPEVQGTIRYNTSINSFEGFGGSFWAGLGGVTKVDGSGSILGTSRTMIGPATAIAFSPPQQYDVWIDTNLEVVKYYNGSDWVVLGAAYSP